MSDEARHGWSGGFPVFVGTPREAISASLRHNYPDVSPEQVTAWRDSIPPLQAEVREIIDGQDEAKKYSVILEYEQA